MYPELTSEYGSLDLLAVIAIDPFSHLNHITELYRARYPPVDVKADRNDEAIHPAKLFITIWISTHHMDNYDYRPPKAVYDCLLAWAAFTLNYVDVINLKAFWRVFPILLTLPESEK